MYPAHGDKGDEDFPDFAFRFTSCRTLGTRWVGADTSKNGGFGEDTPKGHFTICNRTGRKALSCLTSFEDGAKSARYEMRITTELPQMLTVETEGGGDFLIASPEHNKAASTTRMITGGLLAMKVCNGDFITGDGLRGLKRLEEDRAKKR